MICLIRTRRPPFAWWIWYRVNSCKISHRDQWRYAYIGRHDEFAYQDQRAIGWRGALHIEPLHCTLQTCRSTIFARYLFVVLCTQKKQFAMFPISVYPFEVVSGLIDGCANIYSANSYLFPFSLLLHFFLFLYSPAKLVTIKFHIFYVGIWLC